ncbi:MAG: bacteriohemerythrin, partial [Methylovulum sp.]|nr:bacteriohemerythrin [Methylovulum sp.]
MNTKVEIFPWDDNFNTGIPEIDAQHQKLVQLLNELASYLGNQSETPQLNRVFDDLAQYAVYHFKTEEIIWNQYFQDDAWGIAHETTHGQFISELLKIKSHENKELDDEVTEEIVAFLTNWLVFHILESDMRMAKAVLAIRQGASLSEAKKQANTALDGSMKVLIEAILGMYRSLTSRTLQLIREANERKKAESKLRLAENAIESTIEAIVIMDDELNVIE